MRGRTGEERHFVHQLLFFKAAHTTDRMSSIGYYPGDSLLSGLLLSGSAHKLLEQFVSVSDTSLMWLMVIYQTRDESLAFLLIHPPPLPTQAFEAAIVAILPRKHDQ